MAYNRRLFLIKVIKIQEIVINEKRRGCFQKFIYENRIAGEFNVSYSTFNNYLAINARKELSELEKQFAQNNDAELSEDSQK
ncbi:MAG TPA: hypothetical protein DHV48_05695 [Prolixibacteraceae bacterium]|nr:hypothetical protein [Prolixibacteraceae bacterium]